MNLYSVSSPRFAFEIANTCINEVLFDENGYPVRKDGTRGAWTESIIAFGKQYDRLLHYEMTKGMFRLRIVIQNEVSLDN